MERREAARRRRGREAMGEGEYEEYSSHGAEHRCFQGRLPLRYCDCALRVCYPGAGCYFTVMTQRPSLAKMDQSETPAGYASGAGRNYVDVGLLDPE